LQHLSLSMAAKKDFVPVAFDLIGSEAGALLFVDLKKDWAPVVNSDAIKYELKAASGVKNTVKIERAADGKVSGSFESRLPPTTNAALETTITADTKRKVKVAVAQANKLVPGLKTTVTVEALLEKQTQDLKVAFDYKRANLATSVLVTLPVTGYVPSVGATGSTKNSVVFGTAKDNHEVSVGVEVDYHLAKAFIKAINVHALYRNTLPNGWQLSAYSRQGNVEDKTDPSKAAIKKEKHNCGLFIHHRLPKLIGTNAEVAAQLDYDLIKKNTALGVATAFDVAADARLHLKVNTANQLNLVFQHKANDATTIRAGLDVSGDSASVTKGFLEVSLSS
jgi:hypothetical protein